MATYAAAGKLPVIVETFEKAKKASSKAEIITRVNTTQNLVGGCRSGASSGNYDGCRKGLGQTPFLIRVLKLFVPGLFTDTSG